MEKLNSTNEGDSDNSVPDLTANLSEFVSHAVQPTIGLAVVATNIALLYFYKYGTKASKITLLFLRNLTSSDILYGFVAIGRSVVVFTASLQYATHVCRYVVFPAFVTSVTVSAWSILLITIQV